MGEQSHVLMITWDRMNMRMLISGGGVTGELPPKLGLYSE